MPGCLTHLPIHLRALLHALRQHVLANPRALDRLEQILAAVRSDKVDRVVDIWAVLGGGYGIRGGPSGRSVYCNQYGHFFFGDRVSLPRVMDILFN